MKEKLSIISLGCAKNLVNSEQMLYLLEHAGYTIVNEPENSDCVIINTCGFIDAAKSEAIDEILQMANLKAEGIIQKIIVTGCLSERYKDVIEEELPEIDGLIGVASYHKIVNVVEAVFKNEKTIIFEDKNNQELETPRHITTGPSWAFIKIAEGCNNFCAFCSIPYIRGRYKSRSIENIIEEANIFARQGVKELIIIAQDITRYGEDIYGKKSLTDLCKKLSEIDGIEWIRLHYLYPEAFDDELIHEIATNNKIVKYLDIPIQHINDNILKSMNRHTNSKQIKNLFVTLRKEIPGLVLRTSLIAGLPGEGENEFIELCEFLKETKIERVGVFPFSPEEGTPAGKMDHVDDETANRRADLIMDIQSRIMDEFCYSNIGKIIPVLVEYYDHENELYIGRSYMDSPDVDGLVYISGNAIIGEIINVKITGTTDGNLIGEI